MPWLWFAGPAVVLLVYVLLSIWPPAEERRIREELRRWLDDTLGPLRIGEKSRSRRVRQVPPIFSALLDEVGGGTRVTDLVLVPKHAYLAARIADGLASSNHFTVLCQLEKAGPSIDCQPLPVLDGKPAPNRGVQFAKDPEFMELFQVHGSPAKAVTRWLGDDIREALMELPDAWLRVRGKTMALSVYGSADAEKLDRLVDAADAIFAEHGASAASLFGEESGRPPSEPIVDRGYRRPAEELEEPEPEEPAAAVPAPALVRLRASAIDFSLYAVAGLVLAAVLGTFASFHPSALFNSPDIEVTEAWQGGWTTKGVGALIAAETFLVGIFALQAYLGAWHGSSIGMRLLGARVIGPDGEAPGFLRGVLLRRWIFAIVPLLVAAVLARPFSWNTYFAKVVSLPAAGAAILVLAVLGGWLLQRGEGIHDRLSSTRVIVAERWRIPSVQLGVSGEGVDPVAFTRLLRAGGLLLAFAVINFVVVVLLDRGIWPFEAPYRLIDSVFGG